MPSTSTPASCSRNILGQNQYNWLDWLNWLIRMGQPFLHMCSICSMCSMCTICSICTICSMCTICTICTALWVLPLSSLPCVEKGLQNDLRYGWHPSGKFCLPFLLYYSSVRRRKQEKLFGVPGVKYKLLIINGAFLLSGDTGLFMEPGTPLTPFTSAVGRIGGDPDNPEGCLMSVSLNVK